MSRVQPHFIRERTVGARGRHQRAGETAGLRWGRRERVSRRVKGRERRVCCVLAANTMNATYVYVFCAPASQTLRVGGVRAPPNDSTFRRRGAVAMVSCHLIITIAMGAVLRAASCPCNSTCPLQQSWLHGLCWLVRGPGDVKQCIVPAGRQCGPRRPALPPCAK